MGFGDPVVGEQGVSVVLPTWNERGRVGGIVLELIATLSRGGFSGEVVVVDDASTDQSGEVARQAGAAVVGHPLRLGYAASIRTGVERARFETIALFDPDGGYQAADLLRLLSRAPSHAMVVGSRPPGKEGGAWSRRLSRWVLARTAEALAGREIPDLNSGMRVFQRAPYRRIAPMARGFALTTVLTLGMLMEGLAVAWVPVACEGAKARGGARPFTDLFELFHVVARTVLLFNPIKILVPPAYFMILGGLVLLGVDVWKVGEAHGTSILLTLGGIQLLATAFMADLVVTASRARSG